MTIEPSLKSNSEAGNSEVSEMRRLRQLEEENRRLKGIVADQALDIRALKDECRCPYFCAGSKPPWKLPALESYVNPFLPPPFGCARAERLSPKNLLRVRGDSSYLCLE